MDTALVVINPKAGTAQVAKIKEQARKLLADRWQLEVFESAQPQAIVDAVDQSLAQGCKLCIAAGGDGTIASVASSLVGNQVPLGIVPAGTGNALARALEIPLQSQAALSLIADPPARVRLDAIAFDGRIALLNLGAGLNAETVRDLDSQDKQRFGRLSYVGKLITRWMGFQPRKLRVRVDQGEQTLEGYEAMVFNCGSLGEPFLRIDKSITPNDGRLDIFVMRSRQAGDYLRMLMQIIIGRGPQDPSVAYAQATQEIEIWSQEPLPVQADGDYVKDTPVHAKLLHQAVTILSPDSLKLPDKH